MHSNILRQVIEFISNWLIYFEYPWDNLTFTIWDIFIFNIVGIVIVTFFGGIVGFWLRKNHWRD